MRARLSQTMIAALQRFQNAAAWSSSWAYASMSRWAFFSCIGCRSIGASSSSCAVSYTQKSAGESCRLRSSSSHSLIFIVDGLFSASVMHQVRWEWNSLLEDLRAVADPRLFRKQLETHFSVWRLMSVDHINDSVVNLFPIIVIGALEILQWWWWWWWWWWWIMKSLLVVDLCCKSRHFCWLVSMLKADILNIVYDCYS